MGGAGAVEVLYAKAKAEDQRGLWPRKAEYVGCSLVSIMRQSIMDHDDVIEPRNTRFMYRALQQIQD